MPDLTIQVGVHAERDIAAAEADAQRLQALDATHQAMDCASRAIAAVGRALAQAESMTDLAVDDAAQVLADARNLRAACETVEHGLVRPWG